MNDLDIKQPWHSVLTPFLRNSPGFTNIKTPYIGPSSMVNMCEREYALQIKHGTSIYWPFETLMLFMGGFVVEEAMKRILHKGGIRVLSEQLNIPVGDIGFTSPRGRSDQVIQFDDEKLIKTENGSIVLLEIKQMKGQRYKNFKKYGLASEGAAHFQILQYLKNIEFVERLTFPKPDFGALVGFQLDPMDMFDLRVDYTDEMYDQFLPRLEMLDKVKKAKGKFVPDRPFYKDSFECQSCSVFGQCWDVSDNTLNLSTLTGEELEELSNIALEYITERDIAKEADDKKEKLRIWLDKFMTDKNVNRLEISAGLEILTANISESFKRQSDMIRLQENYPDVFEDIISYERASTLRITSKNNPNIKLSSIK